MLEALRLEIELLDRDTTIETTLLIHPAALQDFDAYNQFLNRADKLLITEQRDGIYQIASFHPNYQFAGTSPQDPENFTNRSPHPMLHLLREASLTNAIEVFPDIREIPSRNIKRMNELGAEKMSALLDACVEPAN